MESSETRDGTHAPCIDRRNSKYHTTREVLLYLFDMSFFFLAFPFILTQQDVPGLFCNFCAPAIESAIFHPRLTETFVAS